MALSLSKPILCLVTDPRIDPARLPELVAAAVAGGVNLVQLRLPGLPAGQVFEIGQELARVVRGRAGLIVNDRVDLALALGAAGVQLGEQGLPVAVARRLVGPEFLIGRSVHSPAGAQEAEQAGADYLILGTIFPTRSHPDAPGAGPALVQEVCAAVRVPVIAIGGITAENARSVMEAGATGVAVISALLEAEDPGQAAARLRSVIESSRRTD